MLPFFWPLVFLGGAAVAIAVGANASSKYALSEDCQTNRLADLNPEEMQEWLVEKLLPALDRAQNGRGVIMYEPIPGEPVPQFIVDEVAACQAGLQAEGLTLDEARTLCRIDGKRVYMPADPDDPAELAMYLYQQVTHAHCRVMRVQNWAVDLDSPPGMVPDKKQIIWPSGAAECLFRGIRVVVKMQLYSQDPVDRYIVTPEDLAGVAEVCPMAQWGAGAGAPQNFGVQPINPIPATPKTFAAQRKTIPGMSVGANSEGQLNFGRMADDANRGYLHPAHVLNGAIFQ